MPITGEDLPKTGYTKNTPDSFLLNAGAWVRDLDWDKDTSEWSYDLIGATSGGSKITLKNTYRQVPIDGIFTTPVGADMIESAEATAELNFIELTLINLKTVLLASSEVSDGEKFPAGFTIIKPKDKIGVSDYTKNMAYIGTISGSDKPIIIIFDYAICTSGLEVEPKDKEEAIYTVTFEARTSPDNLDTMALPVTILYPEITKSSGRSMGSDSTTKSIDGVPPEEPDSTEEIEDEGATK